MKQHSIVEILGDGISPELSTSVHAVAATLPVKIDFRPVDLSLAARTQRKQESYETAKLAMSELGVALKYPTTTEGESPNKVLREFCNFSVIDRPV